MTNAPKNAAKPVTVNTLNALMEGPALTRVSIKKGWIVLLNDAGVPCMWYNPRSKYAGHIAAQVAMAVERGGVAVRAV